MDLIDIVVVAVVVGIFVTSFARHEYKVWFEMHDVIRDKDGKITHIVGKGNGNKKHS